MAICTYRDAPGVKFGVMKVSLGKFQKFLLQPAEKGIQITKS